MIKLSLAFICSLFLILQNVNCQAEIVYCTNCSDTWTQAVERVTNLEQLQTLIGQYRESIAQTEQQIALVQNNMRQYENMLLNTRTLPRQLLGVLKNALGSLARDTIRLNVQKGDYMALGQVFDEVYPGLDIIRNLAGGQGDLSADELWDRWSQESDRAALATFQLSGAQLQDLAQNSDALDQHISDLLGTPEGQMEAISAGNQLSAIQIAEAQKLRALMATSIQGATQSSAKREKEEQLAEEHWREFNRPSEFF
jgi:P-type conjugative transfer protein TrbJ